MVWTIKSRPWMLDEAFVNDVFPHKLTLPSELMVPLKPVDPVLTVQEYAVTSLDVEMEQVDTVSPLESTSCIGAAKASPIEDGLKVSLPEMVMLPMVTVSTQ